MIIILSSMVYIIGVTYMTTVVNGYKNLHFNNEFGISYEL